VTGFGKWQKNWKTQIKLMVTDSSQMVAMDWQNEEFHLLAQKGLFWPKERTLFVADPHFGKAATFRKVGIPVSEHTTEDDCGRLLQMLEYTGATRLVFLGDFLHARQGKTDPVRTLLFQWREACANVEIVLVRGNHDLKSGDPWPELSIKCHGEPFLIKHLHCRHHPTDQENQPYLAGHIHPGYSIKGMGRGSVRAACFWVRRESIILPAFGSFTGLKNISPIPGHKIYLSNDQEIVQIRAPRIHKKF
jgi:DNA ligase-associated metallophosphoesterase